MPRPARLAAGGGVAGPLLFTVAWVVGSLRQAGHPAAGVQLSGLAAEDAQGSQIMVAAFAVMGACRIGFGAAHGKNWDQLSLTRTRPGHWMGAMTLSNGSANKTGQSGCESPAAAVMSSGCCSARSRFKNHPR